MNTSHLLNSLERDLQNLGRLGSPELIDMTERLAAAAAPMVQQRFIEQLTLIIAEFNQRHPEASLDLRIAPDEVQLIPLTTRSEPSQPIGELDARFALRLPTDLKEHIDERASQEGISTNSWIVRALSNSLQLRPLRDIGHTLRGRGRS